ncbi:hypothetical protein J2Z69_002411 [Paenibacillus shirakamiensis]|uniref:Uncharacterized protein n=1 Tax=Paenibacillus shirakamiensis TaxID=1265935 RepID=A0ABS4JI15_9BACL|nr:hypothetical protein [Paenibacillus shirakamiensis]MBP2001368.1 hypothetical protein [Paenibacillus shirakamiensis]
MSNKTNQELNNDTMNEETNKVNEPNHELTESTEITEPTEPTEPTEATHETTQEEVEQDHKKWVELIEAVQHNGVVTLQTHFDDVQVQVLNQEIYGPVFVFQVRDASGHAYQCGFFLRELVAKFQSGGNSAEWMGSFFFELMKKEGGATLPEPMANEEEAKTLMDQQLIPQWISDVQAEFAPEDVHAGLDWNEEHGPVFEVGFPAIRDGNNVCAFPINLLLTHYLLNREPSDLLLQGLYKIREEHGME